MSDISQELFTGPLMSASISGMVVGENTRRSPKSKEESYSFIDMHLYVPGSSLLACIRAFTGDVKPNSEEPWLYFIEAIVC